MWPDDEKAAENTYCIVKDFEEVWAHFCPPKPGLPLSTDTTKKENAYDPLFFSGTGNSRYIARRLAAALGAELVSVNDRIKAAIPGQFAPTAA